MAVTDLSSFCNLANMKQVSIKCEMCGTYNDMFAENCMYCGAPLPKNENNDEEYDDDEDQS